MNKQLGRRLRGLDRLLAPISTLVLLAGLFYVFAYAFLTPYPGMTLDAGSAGWSITVIDPCDTYLGWCQANQDGLQALQVGDQLIAIGDLAYEDYRDDRRRVLFDGYGPGESVPITLSREGDRRVIHWQMPVVTVANRARRLIGLLFYLPFWLAGTVVLLLLQPRDRRWRLLVSFNYLTAIWLAVGIASGLQVAASSLVLHAVTWLMVPVYLHLHLIVPTPLLEGRSRYFLPPLYAIAVILATLELFQLLPASAYSLGLLLAIPGSLGLLAFRLFDRSSPSVRPATRLMLAGVGLAFGPSIALWLFPKLLNAPGPGALTVNFVILAVPVLPLFYTYALYKRRLGPLEFRANRLLSLYSFALLYATAFVLVFLIGSQWLSLPDSLVAFSLAVSIVFVIAALPLRSRFQRLVDRLAYGTAHDPNEILRVFASRIPMALNRKALVQLLSHEVAPSLLIRQSALVLLANGEADLDYARGVSPSETPETHWQVQRLLAEAGRYRPPLAEAQGEFDWVRLAIPLGLQEKTIGVWLFGRRDPDDYYPQHDIVLLTALASQVAVAVENARLYQEVQRELAERKRAEEELRQSFEKLRRALEGTINSLVSAIEMRDPYTAGHQRRVTQLACAIARETDLSEEQIEGLRMAGLIHDIGKISIPAEILSKPGQLTELEFDMIKAHSQVGCDILDGTMEFPWPVAQIVLQHHERMDGSGYPQGLSGEEIILEARILGVADAVEAMASDRPYRSGLGIDKALEEISQNRGILYDPEVVDACLKLFTEKQFKFQ
jgi:PAS domain-containing protein